MRRIQLHLDDELDDALAAQARSRGMPKAALIREFLAQHVPKAAGGDPTPAFIGIYEGEPDESERVDQVVYGA